ncbi:hypothetical protein AB1K70_22340 [Bremerella sp. JC770]|uniref:HEAT repeat domain-containing protein n=1 Tax=Bremerella sp. JC770 TaxID=3232137 RepID=UPI00345A94BB
MHDSETRPSRRSFFQIKISSVLFLLFAIGLGLGWWSDHSRLDEQLTEAQLDREIQGRQIAILKASTRSPFPVFVQRQWEVTYSAKSPGHFIELIHQIESVSNAEAWGQALRKATEDYDPNIKKLGQLLVTAPEERTRRNVCIVLRKQYTPPVRDGIEKHHAQLVESVSDMLKLSHPAGTDTHQAILLLGEMGTAAEGSVPALEAIIRDDQHPQAVFATIALGKIRPQFDASSRLIELIHAENVAWQSAVLALLQLRTPDEVEVLLTDLYYEKKNDADRDAIAALMMEAGL